MKKLTYILLSAFLVFAAAACDGKEEGSFYDHPHHNTGSTDTPDPSPEPEDPEKPEYDKTVYTLDESLWKTTTVS